MASEQIRVGGRDPVAHRAPGERDQRPVHKCVQRHRQRLSEHFGIARWVVFGGSWGATLAPAYATSHPDRVRGMVLMAVTMTRRSEVDWLYRGGGRFFPEAWQRFITHAGVAGYALPTDSQPPIEPVLLRHGRLLADPDPGRSCTSSETRDTHGQRDDSRVLSEAADTMTRT